jgi:hypothetical protein
MKKSVLFFILLFTATFSSFAQDYQEVVHLTDGSVVKGFIIEQVPNDYLKIETANGKVYTIEMYEVEKITKERAGARRQNTDRYEYDNQYGNSRSSGNRSNYYDEYDDYDDYYVPRKKNSFGIKAGGTLANMALTDAKNKIGFSGGIFGEFRFNNFAVQPELLFSIQGAKVDVEDYSDVEGKFNLNYLNIPVMAKFYVTEGFSLEAGPQLGVLLSAKAKAKVEGVEGGLDMKDVVNDIDFSLNFGASYQVPRVPLGFYTRYSLGLTNIGKDVDPDDDAGKNRVFQLGLFVRF